MSDESSVSVHHPVKKRGMIGKFFDFVFRIIGILMFSAMISIAFEWMGMAFFYPDQGYSGYEHAQEMLQKEVGYLNHAFQSDVVHSGAIKKASETVDGIVKYLFVDSGILDALASARKENPGDGKVVAIGKRVLSEYFNYLMAAVYIVSMFVVRLAILVLSIPAFILFAVVGLSDGLMQRDLRRWQGGNESGYIYHWAKRFSVPVLLISWIVYLSIPNSVQPNYIITPFAVLFGLVLMVMSSKFKKYL